MMVLHTMNRPRARGPRLALLNAGLCSLLLCACATRPHTDPPASIGASPWALSSGISSAGGDFGGSRQGAQALPGLGPAAMPVWHHHKLPGKQVNQFTPVYVDGRDAMLVRSNTSASLLRQKMHVPAQELGDVKFSWKVPALIAQGDMALRQLDDSPVRIVLAFEGDRSRFSNKNAMMSELSHTLTGEPLPFATLMYVWCNTRPPGTVIFNPRTDRIRKIVVESGAKNLNHWLDYERNIRADFEKAFGEPPGALVGIGIMTDTDNTHSMAKAWYGPLRLAGQ